MIVILTPQPEILVAPRCVRRRTGTHAHGGRRLQWSLLNLNALPLITIINGTTNSNLQPLLLVAEKAKQAKHPLSM